MFFYLAILERGLTSVFKNNMRRVMFFTSGAVLLINSHLSVNCKGWGGERGPAPHHEFASPGQGPPMPTYWTQFSAQ